jgi:hypothetical protein
VTQGRPEGHAEGAGGVLRTHSTEEGGELEGRDPLEGRGERGDASVAGHMQVLRYQEDMSTQLDRIAELAKGSPLGWRGESFLRNRVR